MANEQKSNRRSRSKGQADEISKQRRSSKSEGGSSEAGSQHIPEENRVSNDDQPKVDRLSKDPNSEIPSGDINRQQYFSQHEKIVKNHTEKEDVNPLAQRDDGVLEDLDEYDSSRVAVPVPNQNVPSGQAYIDPNQEINYDGSVPNPNKLSTTVSPIGREDERKGEVIPQPKGATQKAMDGEITISNGEREMKITRMAWEGLKEGSTGGWKEVSPSTPAEVDEKKATKGTKKSKA
jgi:hypothetical protein